jgi:molybdopterin/thiamine biosynthesis adenylyltransferase
MLTSTQKDRYQRQILVIGEAKQEELLKKRVMVVGAGGLGSPLLLYLTAMGIGTIELFEFDTVSLSNLGRQVMYRTADIGKSKGQTTKAELEALNPDVKIILHEEVLKSTNQDPIMKGIDYLVDCSDNFETKLLVNDLGIKYNIPFTIAGIQGYDGQLISVIPHKTACYRCIFGETPKTDKSKPIPIVAPTCGVVGSLEASEVLKGLTNQGERALNKLLIISLFYGEVAETPIKAHPQCLCQKNK